MNAIDLTLPHSLNIPVGFLIQEFSLKELNNIKDDNGYNLFHWAVIKNDAPKIMDLLKHGLNYKLCSTNDFIPDEITNLFPTFYKKNMFGFNGYTFLHLNIILHSIWIHLTNTLNWNDQNLNNLSNQKEILEKFLLYDSSSFNLLDKNGYSVLDYCFLFQNIELINFSLELDLTLSSLVKVKSTTALSIIENISNQKVFFYEKYGSKLIDISNILKSVNIKINYDKLNSKLLKKNVVVLNKIRKI